MSNVPTRVKVVTGIIVYLASSLFWGPWAEARLDDGENDHLLVSERLAQGPALVDVIGLRTQPAPVYEPARASGTAPAARVRVIEPMDGSLPPWSVIMCESGGSYTAENPHSTASGRYQIIDGTWNGYGGYSHASDAPPEVQDAKARELWANGAGRGHWRQCL